MSRMPHRDPALPTRRHGWLIHCLVAATALGVMPARSQEAHGLPTGSPVAAVATPASTDKPEKSDNALIGELPSNSVTHHDLTAAWGHVGYTATAGTLTLRDADGAPSARVFYVAYVADGQQAQKRPVSFFFNGGPGAGSAFLHLGAAGPVVLNFPTSNPTDGANAQIGPNPDSWLRFTDMVFIDAVGTGYSLPEKPAKAAAEFYGVKQDGSAFADAIRIWLEANRRERSPKYLVGESYGGIRSIKTAYALQTEQNIPLAGIVMVSPAIEMSLLGNTDNPVSDAILLPSLIASAQEHDHTLTPQSADDAYRYAFGPYLSTIAGPPLDADAAHQFYAKVAGMTGLPESVVAKERAQLDPQAHDVRSRDGRLYSLYDGTVSIADPYPEGIDNADSPEPVLAGYGLAYGNAFTGYVGDVLGFRTALRYDLLNLKVNSAWDYKQGSETVARGMPDLRKLLALNPSLRVFIANGYFDLTCPFAGSRWLIEHMPVGRDRVRLKVYPGGHMIYTRPDSRAALAHDVAALYAGSP
ncbi:S10 family peptidase [Lichenicola sp.]|uniref:S10 family peptidase n=1 Tax=Lichenicola sp. TaxID=2804529 RepID=UPI003B00EAC9